MKRVNTPGSAAQSSACVCGTFTSSGGEEEIEQDKGCRREKGCAK